MVSPHISTRLANFSNLLHVLFGLAQDSIKQIDKFKKHCLWRGSDINAGKPPKAAWKLVCTPKDEGGLGIIDIEKQNKALLLKNLHKFFNKADLPWVHLV